VGKGRVRGAMLRMELFDQADLLECVCMCVRMCECTEGGGLGLCVCAPVCVWGGGGLVVKGKKISRQGQFKTDHCTQTL